MGILSMVIQLEMDKLRIHDSEEILNSSYHNKKFMIHYHASLYLLNNYLVYNIDFLPQQIPTKTQQNMSKSTYINTAFQI